MPINIPADQLQIFIDMKHDPSIRLDEAIQKHYRIQRRLDVPLDEIQNELSGIDRLVAATAAEASNMTFKKLLGNLVKGFRHARA